MQLLLLQMAHLLQQGKKCSVITEYSVWEVVKYVIAVGKRLYYVTHKQIATKPHLKGCPSFNNRVLPECLNMHNSTIPQFLW